MQKRYDSRYNSKFKEKIGETVEYILSRGYGETLSVEKLSKMLGYNIEIEKEKNQFQTQMVRIKNFLIEYGYVLKGIAGVGYYILKPKQISSYCYRTYVRKTQVLLEKSERILTHVDQTELSDVRIKEHEEQMKLNSDVYDGIGEIINKSDYEKNKNYYDSLED